MQVSVVFLAEYHTYDDALACHEFLQDEGIDSRLDYNSGQSLFEIYVPADQKGWAEYLLANDSHLDNSINQDLDIEEEHQDRSQHFMLIGAVIAMVGILTSFGSFGKVPAEFILFPYSLIAIGSYAFLRGLMLSQWEE